MDKIEFHSRVDHEGVLALRLPLGEQEADRDVVVTIRSLPATSEGNGRKLEWKQFIAQTYGSCAGLGLEEPADLPLPPA